MAGFSFNLKITSATSKLGDLQKRLNKGNLRRIIYQRVKRTFDGLVNKTPTKWTGETRKAWKLLYRGDGYSIVNPTKAIRWLEKGTKAHGPVRAKFLFIPLTRAAALGGYRKGMKFGVDYILTKHVKGIRAMNFIENAIRSLRSGLQTDLKQNALARR